MEIITEQFVALASAIIRANKLPASTIVTVPGNPEYVAKKELAGIADRALAEVVDKLTTVSAA